MPSPIVVRLALLSLAVLIAPWAAADQSETAVVAATPAAETPTTGAPDPAAQAEPVPPAETPPSQTPPSGMPPKTDSPAREVPEPAPAPAPTPALTGDPALRLVRAMDLRGGMRESFGPDAFGQIVFWLVEHTSAAGRDFEEQAAALFRRDLSTAEIEAGLAIFERPDALERPEGAQWAERHRALIEQQATLLGGGTALQGRPALEIGCAAAILEDVFEAAKQEAGIADAGIPPELLDHQETYARSVLGFCSCLMEAAIARWGDAFPEQVAEADVSALSEQLVQTGKCTPP